MITDHVVDVVVYEVQEANKQYNTPNMQLWAYSALWVKFSLVETLKAKPQCFCVHNDVGCFMLEDSESSHNQYNKTFFPIIL